MENKNQTCPIWGVTVASIQQLHDMDGCLIEGSPRTGGDYKITGHAMDLGDIGDLDPAQKARLTTMLIEMRRRGDHAPVVKLDLIEEAKRADPLSHEMRAERLLRYLANMRQRVGQEFTISSIVNDMEALAWSESREGTESEIKFLVDHLTTRGWLQGRLGGYKITVDGYEHVKQQEKKKDLSQCFVAMWFDDSLDSAYEEGIKRAVEECGYKPVRIDQKEDVNKIDDEIIAEIRRSRFVVADFTHDERGDRGAVYYEAGFAYGLGLEVIYSCRKAPKNELNFDTRQYHHILWETPDDLCKQLRDRIRARVGDYKAEPTPATL